MINEREDGNGLVVSTMSSCLDVNCIFNVYLDAGAFCFVQVKSYDWIAVMYAQKRLKPQDHPMICL